MNHELTVERLFQALCAGDRTSARAIIRQCTDEEGVSAEELAHNVFWPSLELLNQLFRADQLSTLAHHYAMRLLRSLADQCQAMFTQEPRRGRKILMFSGECEADELAGQVVRGRRLLAYECQGPLVSLGGFSDIELFVTPTDFTWTMIYTHEDGTYGGPYFVRLEWLPDRPGGV